MKNLTVIIALFSTTTTNAVQAKTISQFDEICVARETAVCWQFNGAASNGYMDAVVTSLYGNTPQRNQANARLNTWRGQFRVSPVKSDDAQVNGIKSCDAFVRSVGNICIVEHDIPTAAELDETIRRANEASLTAWLRALDAQTTSHMNDSSTGQIASDM